MIALALSCANLAAQPAGAAGEARETVVAVRDATMDGLSRRLFPLIDAIGRDAASSAAMKGGAELGPALRVRAERLAACGGDLGCVTQAMVWTDEEATVFASAATGGGADDGPAAQAGREIAGVNAIIRTYGQGQVPPYPTIDGAGAIDPLELRARLQAAFALATSPRAGSAQGIDPSIDFALALLDVSDRTDAIGFDPLTEGLNRAAMARARRIDWRSRRYTALIVTGVGPEKEGMPLSPLGKYHLRLAAQRFARGEASFLIITGGRAHPRETRFTEAQEMREALITRYGISADAIVIEPYARHTTTNLRNATRLLMAMNAPLDRDTLIISNPMQSAMIENPAFAERNMRELGYQPGTVGARVSPTELLFRPSRISARVDPRDPLDP